MYVPPESTYFLPPLDLKELEDLRTLVQYAFTRLEASILSFKLQPKNAEEIERLENKINQALTDL